MPSFQNVLRSLRQGRLGFFAIVCSLMESGGLLPVGVWLRFDRWDIRVSKRVLRTFEARARETGVPYQTLMNRALRIEADKLSVLEP